MKTIINILLITLFSVAVNAQTRLQMAQKQAEENHGLILLNFSGSDWCIPCIKLHKNFIETETFQKLIKDHIIVYLNVDFPRNKKNQPTVSVKKENAGLADQYNPGGIFPYTLLLDQNGKILKSWNGLPSETVITFTDEIRSEFYKIDKN